MHKLIIKDKVLLTKNNPYEEDKYRIILETVDYDKTTLFKIDNIIKNSVEVQLQTVQFTKYLEVFKEEFIDFLKTKHPDKILVNMKDFQDLVAL